MQTALTLSVTLMIQIKVTLFYVYAVPIWNDILSFADIFAAGY